MMRLLIAFKTALFLTTVSSGQYSEQVQMWPQVRVKLSSNLTVSDIFSSGLQVFRRPFAEGRYLYAKHANVIIVDRNGAAFPNLPIDIMRVSVQKPWLILTMELWSPPLTIKETRHEMRKWLPIMSKSEKELEDFLSAVETDWLHYDVVDGASDVVRFADSWRDVDGMKKTVILKKSWQWQAPLIISFEIETTRMRSRRQREYYSGPIPPPPGFEGFDMSAPSDWEADNIFVPLTTEPRPAQGTLPPKYQAMNENAQVDVSVQKSTVAIQLPNKAHEAKPSPTYGEKWDSSMRWFVIVLMTLAATGLLWILVKRHK